MEQIALAAPLLADSLRAWAYFLAIYGVTAAVAAWVYRDARGRGKRYAALWALGTFLFTVFALFPYLYLRLREEGSISE